MCPVKDLRYSIFILTYSSFLWPEIHGVHRTCHIKHNPALDNQSTSSWMFREVILSRGSSPNIECAHLCVSEPSCVTYMLNRDTRVCRMFGARITIRNQLSSEPGFKAYDTCRADDVFGNLCNYNSDCRMAHSVCTDNICQCDHGWSYSPNDLKCVRYCYRYGPEFTKFKNSYISLHDLETLTDSYSRTPDGCGAACVSATAFTCRSFELTSSKCRLQSVTTYDVTILDYILSLLAFGIDYYQRHCEYSNN